MDKKRLRPLLRKVCRDGAVVTWVMEERWRGRSSHNTIQDLGISIIRDPAIPGCASVPCHCQTPTDFHFWKHVLLIHFLFKGVHMRYVSTWCVGRPTSSILPVSLFFSCLGYCIAIIAIYLWLSYAYEVKKCFYYAIVFLLYIFATISLAKWQGTLIENLSV